MMNKQSVTITPEEQTTKDREKIDKMRGYKAIFEPRWYISSAFYDGKHFTFGKKDKLGNWLSAAQPKNRTIREIPKAKKQIQNMRNMVLKPKRKPVVYPDMNVIGMLDGEEMRVEENHAKQQAKVVQYYWDEVIKVKRYYKKIVRLAELHSHAFAQIVNEGEGRYKLEVLDAFDGSCHPTITAIKDFPVFVKHVSKTLKELRECGWYDSKALDEIEQNLGDGKYSASSYKQDLMVEKYGKADPDNLLIDEMYELVLVPSQQYPAGSVPAKVADTTGGGYPDGTDEETKEPKAESEEGEGEMDQRVRIVSYVHQTKIGEQIIPLSRLPIAMYVWGDEAYETSVMEDMMPGNRVYDNIVSKLEQKVRKLDTGRMLVQKGEDAKVITTDDGELIRWKRVRPEMMEEASLTNTVLEALNRTESDIKEAGVSLTSSADIPAGVEAWGAIESLKESDRESLAVPMDNFDEFIVELTESLVEMIAYDAVDVNYARYKNDNGTTEQIKYIGKRGADVYKKMGVELPSDVVVINPNRTVKVEMESALAWTETGKKKIIMELSTMMANAGSPLPPDVILDLMDVGNTAEIVDKIKYFQTFGQSLVDMPDFKVLPLELQQAIARYLSQGADVSSGRPPVSATPPVAALPAGGAAPKKQMPASGNSAPWHS